MNEDRTATDETPPAAIGPPQLRLRVEGRTEASPPARITRAVVVGLMFSVFPVILTNLVLTEAEAGFDPRSLAAVVPVLGVALWLSQPRDRWYAVGPSGFAMGERFFGQLRWDHFLFEDIEQIEVSTQRAQDGTGAYRFTGYRFVFEGPRRKRVVLEGQVDEPLPHGSEVRLPRSEALPPTHELRAARAAVEAWSKRTGRRPQLVGTAL